MNINWFPGHMTKALRTMQAEIKNIDCVIYVLDSRAPVACLNPEFDKLINGKPVLVVLNKMDMCDKSKIPPIKTYIKKYFETQIKILELNSTLSGALKIVLAKIEILCKEKIERNEQKGLNTFIKAMVIGVPNSGKSTLVNNLCGKAKAKTGNKAGVTRGKQWVTVSQTIQILDTPGTLYPNLSNEKSARYLAYLGSIKDEVLDTNELAVFFVKDITKQYPKVLENRYQIELQGEPYEMIEQIALSKKFVLKGGDVDYDRTCIMILDDFRKTRLGNLTLT
ncbi:MAG: ribosome biogenesis GTPase YlqF [Clostridia bacterium]|nr:ribosome biogenesis GTPase YlqF [Clostridia bacterium]